VNRRLLPAIKYADSLWINGKRSCQTDNLYLKPHYPTNCIKLNEPRRNLLPILRQMQIAQYGRHLWVSLSEKTETYRLDTSRIGKRLLYPNFSDPQ